MGLVDGEGPGQQRGVELKLKRQGVSPKHGGTAGARNWTVVRRFALATFTSGAMNSGGRDYLVSVR